MMNNNKNFSYYLNEFFTSYLVNEINASQNTIISYKNVFNLLISYLINVKKIEINNINFETIDKNMIKDFLKYLEEARLCSITTRNQRLAAIKSFYQYVKIEDPTYLMNFQNILNIKNKKTEKKLKEYLTIDELKKFFQSINTNTNKGRRDLVLLTLLYDAGLRLSEILNLKVMDLKLDDNPTVSVIGKGRKMRSVPIMDNTKKMLLQYISENNFSNISYLFSNSKKEKLTPRCIQKIVDKYMKKSNINKNISPHAFRRSRAMHLLEADINVVYIRDFLGHESMTTTEIYAQANETRKRDAISKAYQDILPSNAETSWNKNQDLLEKLLSLR